MFGALYGDVIGSYYENHCTKDYHFAFQPDSTFTDDSVLTAAVCETILQNSADISRRDIKKRAWEYAAQYRRYYSRYPNAGFGNMFAAWAKSDTRNIIYSYGNGAAMRVIPIAYAYRDEEQMLLQVAASCFYTHKNKEALYGAQAVALCVHMALNGETKDAIRREISRRFRYDFTVSLNELRSNYTFDSRTGYSVPPAILAFLESSDYESAIRLAISLGGDADTMACIAGGIAEAYYGEIPDAIRTFCDRKIDISIRKTVCGFAERFVQAKI